MVLKRETRGMIKALESVRQMSRLSIRLWLTASHGKSFQNSAQTTFRCCLSGMSTLGWSVPMPEDDPASPNRIGSSSVNALTSVSMRYHRSGSCPDVWRPSVTF